MHLLLVNSHLNVGHRNTVFVCALLLNKLSLSLEMTTQKLAKAYNCLVLKQNGFLGALSQGKDGRHSREESGSFRPQIFSSHLR